MALLYFGATIDSMARIPILAHADRSPGISPAVNLTYSFGKHVLGAAAGGVEAVVESVRGN